MIYHGQKNWWIIRKGLVLKYIEERTIHKLISLKFQALANTYERIGKEQHGSTVKTLRSQSQNLRRVDDAVKKALYSSQYLYSLTTRWCIRLKICFTLYQRNQRQYFRMVQFARYSSEDSPSKILHGIKPLPSDHLLNFDALWTIQSRFLYRTILSSRVLSEKIVMPSR